MSFLLFLDESGIDGSSPYEVLAGICFEDKDLWNFIQRVHEGEEAHFGRRMTLGLKETKGSKLLEKKSFKHAEASSIFNTYERQRLVKEFFEENERVRGTSENPKITKDHFTAYGQARLQFVHYLLDLCNDFRAKAFASIVMRGSPRPEGTDYLRKDYAFLFERYYYFLEEKGADIQGFIVFDELEKSQSHLLVDQMERYFTKTANGRARFNRIIPEPLLVHSHLTTLIQVSDIIAYVINLGVRLPGMNKSARPELEPFIAKVLNLRYQTTITDENGNMQKIWGFKYLNDLRGQRDR